MRVMIATYQHFAVRCSLISRECSDLELFGPLFEMFQRMMIIFSRRPLF